MQTSPDGIALIKKFEGCRLTAYPDPGTGDAPWTIGYGWTHPVDGKPVKRGMTIDQQTADRLLKTGLVGYENDVLKVVRVKLTQGQFDALVSFAYNVGSDIDADTIPEGLGDSTLLRLVNANPNDPRIYAYKVAGDGIAATGSCELLKWVSRGTPYERGLRRRRQAEADLYRS